MKRVDRIRWAAAGGVGAAAVWALLAGRPGPPPPAPPAAEAAPSPVAVDGAPEFLRLEHASAPRSVRAGEDVFTVTPLEDGSTERTVMLVAPMIDGTAGPGGYRFAIDGAKVGRMPSGAPDLPLLSTVVPGVYGMVARVVIESVSYRDFPDLDIPPVAEIYPHVDLDGTDALRTRLANDPARYGADAFWPPEPVSVEEAVQAGTKWTRLTYSPLQYHPVTRTLRYVETVSARLVVEPEPMVTLPRVALASEGVPDPFDCPPGMSDPVLPEVNGYPSDFAVRRAGAEVDARYKITVAQGGVYRITTAELTAAGIAAADLVGSRIRMFYRDREIAIHTTTDGAFGPLDYLVFVAEGYDRVHSGENVYWLGLGGSGLRMTQENGQVLADAEEVGTHFRTLFLGENTKYITYVSPQNEDWDHWYDTLLQNNPFVTRTYSAVLPTDDPAAMGMAKFSVCLHAATENQVSHELEIRINGALVDVLTWTGSYSVNGSFCGSTTVPATLIHDMTTEIDLRLASSPDGAYFERAALIYPRTIIADASGYIEFTGEIGPRNYTVGGLAHADGIVVFDTSDAVHPAILTGCSIGADGNEYQIRFGRDASVRPAFLVVRLPDLGSMEHRVTSIEEVMIRGLADTTRQADYVVVTPYRFRSEAYRLATNRYARGSTVAIAPLEDIYNEFSFGVRDPDAIRQFVGFAYHHWKDPNPTAIVLLGDATEDPRGYQNPTVADVIPAPLGATPYRYAALDVKSVQVDGDDTLADLALGRIPVRDIGGLSTVVDKIISYEQVPLATSVRRRALLIAGGEQTTSLGFMDSAQEVGAIMAAKWAGGAYDIAEEYAADANSKQRILNALEIGSGRFVTAYFGHGSAKRWNGDPPPVIFDTATVAESLNNAILPIITAATCNNGEFLDPDLADEGLAEVLLEAPGKGAIAVLAGTSLSVNDHANEIAIGFYESLIAGDAKTLGEAMLAAYFYAWTNPQYKTAKELTFFQIFGDPGLIVKP